MTGVARLGAGIRLVGREPELAALDAALRRAATGRPTGVLMSGDAGVGKSRMVAETLTMARESGFTVLVGHCLDTTDFALPYLPFTEIVGALAESAPELVTRHTALRHLLPGGFAAGTGGDPSRELRQLQVFDAVLSVLHELSTTAPVLLVVEDLHWSDRTSRDLLTFLLSRLSGQRLVVLATYRNDDLHRRHPLRGVLSELVRLPAVERVDLAPLPPEHAYELVRLLADDGLPESTLRQVAQRSEGNAFFAEELVSAPAADGLPHALVDVLIARVEGRSPATQSVLRAASVAGRRVPHSRLAAVCELPVEELEQALREAVAHHILVPTDDTYTFRHALLREAIYHELLPGERSRLHLAYAAQFTVTDPESGRPSAVAGRAVALARHAFAGHDLPLALAASVQAAREAADREAPAEVLLHAERAIELWPAVPDAEAVAGADEILVTQWAAWAASITGDPARGIALGRRALVLTDAHSDPVTKAAVLRRYALRLLDLPAAHGQEALDAAREAVGLLPPDPPTADLAGAHAALARILGFLDRLPEAQAEAELALSVARSVTGDTEALLDAQVHAADALATLAQMVEFGGDLERSRELLAEAESLAHRSGNLPVELRTFYARGLSLLDAGSLAEASAVFVAGEQRARATGTTWSRYGLNLRVAHVLADFMRGAWDSADTTAEIAGESVSVAVATRLSAAGLLTAVGRGRFAATENRLTQLREMHHGDDQVVVLVGQAGAEAALWRGRPAEAAEIVGEALAALDAIPGATAPHLAKIMLAALGVAAQAELVTRGERPAEEGTTAAKELVGVAEYVAEHSLPRGGELGPEGRAWLERARAELTRVTGTPDPEAWQRVVAAFGYETEGIGYRQAYALLRHAEAVLAGGGTPRAVEAGLLAAHTTATELGADPLATAVAALADRAGVHLSATTPARTSAPDLLTRRERSVLTLVANGLTNRRIGAELFISEKTVSVHLSRVMAKLGAHSRTEAVRIAYEQGMLGGHSD